MPVVHVCTFPGCQYTSPRSNNFERHLRTHTGAPPRRPDGRKAAKAVSRPLPSSLTRAFRSCRGQAVPMHRSGLRVRLERLWRAAAPQPPPLRAAPGTV